MNEPPCAGKWELFDSVDLAAHLEAKALCEACPVLDWCVAQLRRAFENVEYQGYGPQGTWAGQYVGKTGRVVTPRRREAVCGTPSGYKRHYRKGTPYCDACKAAQAAYVREKNAAKEAS